VILTFGLLVMDVSLFLMPHGQSTDTAKRLWRSGPWKPSVRPAYLDN